MNLKQLFDVFSRRRRPSEKPRKPLGAEFRRRVLMLCRDRFSPRHSGYAALADYRHEFWNEIHRRLTFLLGRHQLSDDPRVSSADHDVLAFLDQCEDEYFLDFIEYIFQVDCYRHIGDDENRMVEEIDDLFRLDDLPYALTRFVRETRTEEYHGRPAQVLHLVAQPQVVLRDHQVTFAEAISPTLQLLADKGFTSANREFLDALEDYRKGRYADCLTKSCSAFESTMKLICARRGWPHSDRDTAASLLKVILSNSSLDAFFEQPLLTIATLRNRLSSSHGAGTQPRVVPAHKARYALNATAAAILLLTEECA